MATIIPVKRKKGTGYQVVIRTKGHDPLKRTFNTKGEARQWANEQESLIYAKRYRDPRLAEMVTIGDALQKYIEKVSSRKAASTHDREKHSRRHLVRILGEDTSLAAITTSVVSQYQDIRIDEEASSSSIRQELCLLSRLFEKARKEWEIPVQNPVDDVERVPPGHGRTRFLTREEAEIIVKESREARNKRFFPFVILLMHSGMRTGEAARLRKGDVNLEEHTITITRTKSGRQRTIPLTDAAAEALKTIDTDDYFFLKPNHLASHHIMLRPGCIFRECWTRLHERLKKQGIAVEHFTVHDLRHTAASHLLMAGVDIRVVADILGHSTLQMAMRYTHLLGLYKKNTIDKIGRLGLEEE
jgi:integrase